MYKSLECAIPLKNDNGLSFSDHRNHLLVCYLVWFCSVYWSIFFSFFFFISFSVRWHFSPNMSFHISIFLRWVICHCPFLHKVWVRRKEKKEKKMEEKIVVVRFQKKKSKQKKEDRGREHWMYEDWLCLCPSSTQKVDCLENFRFASFHNFVQFFFCFYFFLNFMLGPVHIWGLRVHKGSNHVTMNNGHIGHTESIQPIN